MKANDLSQFEFKKVSSGAYDVSYILKRGDFYKATITDMPLIDATKNAEYAKLKDIHFLAFMVKLKGKHYSANGKQIFPPKKG